MDERCIAKLNKSRMVVKCGTCGAPVASVFHFYEFDEDEDEDEDQDLEVPPPTRLLVFDTGWLPNAEGIWRLTNYAKRQIAHGRKPSVRRQFQRPCIIESFQPFDPVKPAFWQVQPHESTAKFLSRLDVWQIPHKLPIRAECPRCKAIQFCDSEVLDVANEVDAEWANIDGRTPVGEEGFEYAMTSF